MKIDHFRSIVRTMDAPPARTLETDRTRLHRRRQRGSHERAEICAVLDAAIVCHVGFATRHGPAVIPTTFVRVDDALYVHGACASRLGRADGSPLCLVVTLVDGLVLARSAMHHSMNYRSVVVYGTATIVDDDAEKKRVLAALVDRVSPGRAAQVRPPSPAELAATALLRLPLAEASLKVRTGPPLDDPEDLDWPCWAGVVPLAEHACAPEAAPDLRGDWPAPHR
jgi:nitroimidazol reductase NimA-like FMN-containing flavoprotein (pyridoxamine 5'-phosphate oxidase superfamily)